MKISMIKIIITLIGLVLIGIGLYYFFSTNSKVSIEARTILIDVTEPLEVLPDAEVFKQKFGFQQTLWKGAHVRVRTLTDIVFSNIYEREIAPASSWLSNEQERIAEVNMFFSFIEQSLNSAGVNNDELIQSSIYTSVVYELNYLSSLSASIKELYIFSDLRENSELLNTYKKSVLARLNSDKEGIRKQLESSSKLDNLTGIKVYIIFQPKDYYSAKPFESLAQIYSEIIEDNGGEVHISNNL
jgi:hypothetical protein